VLVIPKDLTSLATMYASTLAFVDTCELVSVFLVTVFLSDYTPHMNDVGTELVECPIYQQVSLSSYERSVQLMYLSSRGIHSLKPSKTTVFHTSGLT
jgi:hypothetical protein